jgi:hypothetical protein
MGETQQRQGPCPSTLVLPATCWGLGGPLWLTEVLDEQGGGTTIGAGADLILKAKGHHLHPERCGVIHSCHINRRLP